MFDEPTIERTTFEGSLDRAPVWSAPATGIEAPSKLRVAVLVNLFWRPDAGGHVKCWERFAEAAGDLGDFLDLTVHFSGERDETHDFSDNVRFRIWRPLFSTKRLPFLSVAPDHTDLGGYHPRLARDLAECDVIHTTDAFFAFAITAGRVSRDTGIPLVHSTHTDTPGYAQIFTARIIERLMGNNGLSRLFIDGARVPERVRKSMERKLDDHRRQAAFTMVSSREERHHIVHRLPGSEVFHLGRGLDFDRFNPNRADRKRLAERYGVPDTGFLIAFAGRLNVGKNVGLFTRALDRDWMAEHGAHILFAGDGEDRAALAEHFGPHASFPGVVDQAELAGVYASADAFAFPSMVEISSNVVREALASGTCVLASSQSGVSRDVDDGETGFHLSGEDADAWRRVLEELAGDPDRTAAMGAAARTWAETHLRTWGRVLAEDLMPVWRLAAGGRG